MAIDLNVPRPLWHAKNIFRMLKPIFHQKTAWRRVKFASPTNEMYMPDAKTQRQDPTPPLFHWLASGFGVGANANFRFGVGSLASGNAKFSHLRYQHVGISNAKVGRRGHCPTPAPEARYFAFWWNIVSRFYLKGLLSYAYLYNHFSPVLL